MSDRGKGLGALYDELVELNADAREARLAEIGATDEALRRRLEAMFAADTSPEQAVPGATPGRTAGVAGFFRELRPTPDRGRR